MAECLIRQIGCLMKHTVNAVMHIYKT